MHNLLEILERMRSNLVKHALKQVLVNELDGSGLDTIAHILLVSITGLSGSSQSLWLIGLYRLEDLR